jgi:hypothetical protein
LTAQEAFEQEGYIAFESHSARVPGEVVENKNPGILEADTKLVIVGEITWPEYQAYRKRCGLCFRTENQCKIYKAVAE